MLAKREDGFTVSLAKYEDFPNAAYISDRTISIPFSAKLNEKDTQDVIDAITKVINHNTK